MNQHKAEVIKVLRHVHERLKNTAEPLEGLERRMLAATVEYGLEEAEALQEVKRVRKPGVPTAPSVL